MTKLAKDIPVALNVLSATLFLMLVVSANETVRNSSRGEETVPSAKTSNQNLFRLKETYGKLPLSFEVNEGQVDSQVKFLSRGHGYTLFLTPTEAVLKLAKPSPVPSDTAEPGEMLAKVHRKIGQEPHESTVVRMQLLHSNRKAKIEGIQELPGHSNYFIGSDPRRWRSGVATYGKVKYENAYPGIDIIYYGNQRQLEYDFVVKPGADPSQVCLRFDGAEKIQLDESGDLILTTKNGDVRQHEPAIYQEVAGNRKQIAGSYVVNSRREVGFEVGSYDRSQTLVIDPVLIYSTYLGGSGFEEFGNGIAVDSVGNAYVTGYASSTNFPTLNAYQPTHGGGNRDAFVAKLTSSGGLSYSTYLGGSSDDQAFGIAIDTAANAYVTGWTASSNFPVLNGFQASYAGGADAFVTKLTTSGGLSYSTYLGGSNFEVGYGIALDTADNTYVTGDTGSINFPTLNAFQASYGGTPNGDAFVTKLSASGGLSYSTYLGGSNFDSGRGGIAVDSAGNAYVSGVTNSTNFPTLNAFQPSYGGFAQTGDAFVTKLATTGALNYSTYLGGGDGDVGRSIGVDSAGNAYVTGETRSTNFPILNALQSSLCGSTNAFVTKLTANGGLGYSTYLRACANSSGWGIAVDSSGNAHITGIAFSADFPTLNAFQSFLGSSDAFVIKLTPSGALSYSTFLGGSGTEIGRGIAIDLSGNAYVTGETTSTNFPTVSATQPLFGGGQTDVFVAKMSAAVPQINRPPVVSVNVSSVTVSEGTNALNAGSFSDPDAGDTVSLSASIGSIGPTGSNTWSWSYGTTDGPIQSQTVTIIASDSSAATSTTMFSLIVSNVAPVINSVSGPVGPLALGTPATVSADFTDVGTQDTHTCTLSWDDGQASTSGTVTESPGIGSCSGVRTFSTAGVYTVLVTVTDDDGGSTSRALEFVVIYDPSAGFVTGGGWIDSPTGAYPANPSLTGRANFGFVSKYKKGTNIPEGQTEFQFRVAGFNFHSTAYQWLVVAGPKAQYKGTGTVNATGNYGFLLMARDGQQPGGGGVDKFRIKVWDKNNNDAVVYDNVLGASEDIDSANPQAIDGGSIVIHTN